MYIQNLTTFYAPTKLLLNEKSTNWDGVSPKLFSFVYYEYFSLELLGALNPFFQSFVNNLTLTHCPTIMIITETKVSGSRAKDIIDRFCLNGAFHANNIGYTGGMWVLWNST